MDEMVVRSCSSNYQTFRYYTVRSGTYSFSKHTATD